MSIFDEKETKQHESYALVQFSRIGGKFDNLFGTSVETGTAIALRIKRAEVDRGLNRSWYHGREELIEVILSPNQFSELLTTMNYGSGVPCTINTFNGKRMEEPPKEKAETEVVRDEFEKKCKEIDSKMNEFGQQIVELLNKKSINKGDREQILDHMRMLHREVKANFPYMLKSFEESAQDIVQDAKAAVDAFVTTTVANAGIKAIAENEGIVALPTLEDKGE